MRTRKLTLVALAIVVIGIGIALAQEGGGGGGGRGGGGGFGGGRGFDPAQMMQRNLDRIKEALAPTDEEWTALKPKLEQVLTLSQDARMSMRMGFGGRSGGGMSSETPQTPVASAAAALQTTLSNESATPEEIKAKLTALREAREKANEELAKAQAALRELLTVRQEAQLVLMGTLD